MRPRTEFAARSGFRDSQREWGADFADGFFRAFMAVSFLEHRPPPVLLAASGYLGPPGLHEGKRPPMQALLVEPPSGYSDVTMLGLETRRDV